MNGIRDVHMSAPIQDHTVDGCEILHQLVDLQNPVIISL